MRDVQRWRRRGLLLACAAVGLIAPTVAVAAGTTATRAEQDAVTRFEQARQRAAADTPRSRVQAATETEPTGEPTEDPDVRFGKHAVRTWPELPDDAGTYQLEVRVTNRSDDAVRLAGWIDFDRDGDRAEDERTTANVKPGKSTRTIKLTWRELTDLEPGKAKAELHLDGEESSGAVRIVPAPVEGCDTGDSSGPGDPPEGYGELSDSATHPVDGLRYAVSSFGSLVRWDARTGRHASTYPDAVVPQGAYEEAVFDAAGDLYAADSRSGKVYQLDLRSSRHDKPANLKVIAWGRPVGKPVLGTCMRALDFGDAPGPAHRSGPELTLGKASTAEPESVPNDLGDDAIGEVPAIEPYTTQYALTVSYRNLTNAPVTLAGWLDLDLDGKLSRDERRVVVLRPGDPAPELRWPVDEIRPSGTAGLRLRLYKGEPENPSPEDVVDDLGEVEDYSVRVHSSPISDLSVASLPVQVVAGRSGTLPIVVRNRGPEDADLDAMVTVTPPEHVTFGEPPSSCAADLDGTVSCRLPADRLPASGDPIALQLPFDVDASAPSEAGLTGGRVKVDKPRDPELADNTADLRVQTGQAISDLSTRIVRAPRPVAPGQPATVAVRLDNAGPSDTARPAKLVVRLPDDSTAADALPADCAASDREIGCTVPAGLPAGGHRTYDIPVVPGSGLAEDTTLEGGTAELTLADDPDGTDNDAPFSLRTNEPVTDLVLSTGSDRTRPVPPGGTFPFTVKLTNRGPSDARDVALAESLPAVLTLEDSLSTKGCTAALNQLGCEHDVIRAGETVTYRLTARLASTYSGDGSDLADSGFVNTPTRDVELANNATRNGLPTAGVSRSRIDLRTSVSAPREIMPGTEDSLTLTVRNLGPSDTGGQARQVVTLPMSVTAADLQPKGCTPGEDRTSVTCRVPAGLSPGEAHSWRVPVQVASGSRPGGVFGGGRVETREPADPNLDDNRAGFRVRAGRSAADLVMTKRPTTSRPVGPGGTFSYELSVTNSGPSTASNVVVRDRLPQPLTYLRSPDGCEPRDRRLTCPAVDSLAPGEFEAYRVEVKLDPRYRGDGRAIAELATVSSDIRDPDTTNNRSELRTSGVPGGVVAHPATDLALVLTAEDGDSFELTAYNKGSREAVHQTIEGYLPAALLLVSSPDGCTASGQRFTCPAVESFEPGDSVKRRIAVRRNPVYTGDGSDLMLWATVRSYSVDDRPGNNAVTW